MIFDNLRKRLVIIAGAMALAGSGAAAAQGDYGQGQEGGAYQTQQQAPSAENLSDEKLAAFVEAQEKVETISQNFRNEAQNTEDPSEVTEMQQQVNQQMVAAVRDAGLEPTEYNEIARAVRSNPELEKKVEEMR